MKRLACYRKALQLNPYFVEAYNNLGVDLKERGDLQELCSISEVLQLNPALLKHTTISQHIGRSGKLPDAESYYTDALWK